jgi:uncharacterized membrane protein YphA (DoxX/SURF4 family)
MKLKLGRHVFGLAAILFGVITFAFRDFSGGWQQIRPLGDVPHRELLVYLSAAAQLCGGLAIQWRKTARIGAMVLLATYLAFALLWVPNVLAELKVYDRYGNFFEQFSLVSGALIVYALAFYLSGTASFVPKWIPPGQMLWSITTTVALALAALSLLSGIRALLAAGLLTVMFIGFGLLVWLPILIADPHKQFNWAGNAQNLAITGAAWIVTDYLSQKRTTPQFA